MANGNSAYRCDWQHWLAELESLSTTGKVADNGPTATGFLTHVQTDAFWLNRSALLWQSHSEHWCIGSGLQPTNGCSQQDGWLFSPEYPDITLAEYMPENMGFYGLRNTAQPGHITLANSSGRIRLVISNQGRMRLCSEQHSQGRIPLCH